MSPVKGCHNVTGGVRLWYEHITCPEWHWHHPITCRGLNTRSISPRYFDAAPVLCPQGAVNVVTPFNNQRNIFLTPQFNVNSNAVCRNDVSSCHWRTTVSPFSPPYLHSLAACRQMYVKIFQLIPKFIFSKSSAQGLFLFFPEIFLTLTPQAYLLWIINFCNGAFSFAGILFNIRK